MPTNDPSTTSGVDPQGETLEEELAAYKAAAEEEARIVDERGKEIERLEAENSDLRAKVNSLGNMLIWVIEIAYYKERDQAASQPDVEPATPSGEEEGLRAEVARLKAKLEEMDQVMMFASGRPAPSLRALNETITDTIHNLNTQSANSITSTNEEWRGVFLRLQEQVNAALEGKG